MFSYFLEVELVFTLVVALACAIAFWLVGIHVSSDTVEDSGERETMIEKQTLEGYLR